MKIHRFFSAVVCAVALSSLSTLCVATPSSSGVALDTGGVKVESSLNLNGSSLQLNGAGVRYKAIFKVYTAALYLEKKYSETEELLHASGAKRMSLTMLRDMDANELGRLFTKGVEANVPYSELSKMIPHLMRMGQIFADQKKIVAGDTINIDWVPGVGTLISIKGVLQGEAFKDPEFFTGMMRIWLGKSPADYRLKDALLGKPVEVAGQYR